MDTRCDGLPRTSLRPRRFDRTQADPSVMKLTLLRRQTTLSSRSCDAPQHPWPILLAVSAAPSPRTPSAPSDQILVIRAAPARNRSRASRRSFGASPPRPRRVRLLPVPPSARALGPPCPALHEPKRPTGGWKLLLRVGPKPPGPGIQPLRKGDWRRHRPVIRLHVASCAQA